MALANEEEYSYVYTPSLKTSDAELKAYDNLSSDIKSELLPIFELTKSRKTSRNLNSSVQRRLDQLKKLVEARPFILDLTLHDDQTTPEIGELFVEDNGFENWRNFLADIGFEHVVPTVHAFEGCEKTNIAIQAEELERTYGYLCVRIAPDIEDVEEFVKVVFDAVQNTSNVFVVIDGGFILQSGAGYFARKTQSVIKAISALGEPAAFIPLASSFPSAVAKKDYGGDSFGKFDMEEWLAFEALTAQKIEGLVYGDYGSIHPVRYRTKGGGWVPRVDEPRNNTYSYRRYRRKDGGYKKAAEHLVLEAGYMPMECWGYNQIDDASNGILSGKSPQHWIAVRVNIHITRRVQLLNEML